MKKSVVHLLSGCIALTTIMLASCSKELPGLKLDMETPTEEGASLTISQGDTLKIPFSVSQLEGFSIAVEATCANENYAVSAALDETGNKGVITVAAPKFIFESEEIAIDFKAVDATNSRTVSKLITVSAESTLQDQAVSSNCHLVSPGQFIKFAAVKGNSTEKVAAEKVELLWEDAVGLVDSVFTLTKDEIYVNLAKELQGNAVVAAKDAEGTILWSWHIWVSKEDPTANLMPYTYTPAEGESQSFQFMDRNLGAMSSELGTAAVNGCFYQWGRKDPFPGPNYDGTIKAIYNSKGEVTEIATETVAEDNNIETAVKNPMTRYNGVSGGNYGWITKDVAAINKDLVFDIWGGVSKKKSMYDPCPAGYRMPQLAAWQFLSDANVTKTRVFRADAPEKPANSDQMGYKVTVEGKDFFFPHQGEANQKTTLKEAYTNGYGKSGNNWPCGKLWSSQFDSGNFDGTAAKKSYFRAYTNNVTPTSFSYYANFNLGYVVGVRCIKE